ncbi:MAG TPA: flagellar protein FlgN [Gammaproteobacteria bacterium]|nr:flagellar protein FlgN [Gammaproteobacteria bacterium]
MMQSSTSQPLSLELILLFTKSKMQQLLQTLMNEKEVLANNDIHHLEKITQEKTKLTDDIEKNEQQRINFLNAKALDPNEPSQWLVSKKLSAIWKEIKEISEKAQKQNQINGQVINGSRRRVKTKIEILSTATPSAELTYSSSGENISQRTSKTLAHA